VYSPAQVVPTVRFERYADFRRWVENQPGYWQLIRGIPLPSPAPNIRHQWIVGELYARFRRSVMEKGLGWVFLAPTDVKLREDTVYQPDLVVVLYEYRDRIRETHIEGAPDVVVEVLSHATAKRDLIDKRYDYEQSGVQEYWVVDPETGIVEVYGWEEKRFNVVARARSSGTVESRVITGLKMDVGELFRKMEPDD